MKISWNAFKFYNSDGESQRTNFEALCRLLFCRENLSFNERCRYLHANPNNAGLECDPIFDEKNNRYVGFQAKFYDDKANYSDIKDSAEKIVKYYSGKVEYVFLFCNKPLTEQSLSESREILRNASITLELITDEAILDLVRHKYHDLGSYFFGNHYITKEWLYEQNERVFDELGVRFDRHFNVETQASKELSLFVMDETAVRYINSKKEELLKEVDSLYWGQERGYSSYLTAVKEETLKIADIDGNSVRDSFEWASILRYNLSDYFDRLNEKIEALKQAQSEFVEMPYDEENVVEQQSRRRKYHSIETEIRKIEKLINLVGFLELTDREKELIVKDALFIYGKAGIGKTQLFANEMQKIEKTGRYGLILSAGVFYDQGEPIENQIMNNLGLDYSFSELIEIMEVIGESTNNIFPIFIDALNETWNRNLWQRGLAVIIGEIEKAPMVRLAVSYRTEYGREIISNAVRKRLEEGRILELFHKGFENNSILAIKEFLNYYHIPFTPAEHLGFEMTNPLYLTLYCRTYNGDEVDLAMLYDRVIESASSKLLGELKKGKLAVQYTDGDNYLAPLIAEISEKFVLEGKKFFERSDLSELEYWSSYGLSMPEVITLLVKEQVLHSTIIEDQEAFRFSFDQMNDYYAAKSIFKKHKDKENIRKYMSKKLLGLENGQFINFENTDIFVNACALYAEKFKEECIDIIDAVQAEEDKEYLFSRYLESFKWRKGGSFSAETFVKYIKKYSCYVNEAWEVLIGNSIKIANPLNADFLHETLMGYELNRRDYLWTIFINQLPLDADNRIVQLVELYNRGESLDIENSKQKELLLTLFTWLLTSSNRWLRDTVSKALIEILKTDLSFCRLLLEKFHGVNDPYVTQRLYGIVFGACCKRTNGDLEELAEFIYEKVFNKEKVYPDILLRDYARLIIERFLYENPGYNGIIDKEKIMPPYKSDPIPQLEEQHYQEQEFKGTKAWIVMSMKMEGMGMYGDFGRYVFQRALSSFDVNDKELFNYALYYIFQVLAFREELFDDHDKNCGSYDRYLTAKTERIGKKYQWIAMYNILARVSDHSKMVDKWSGSGVSDLRFEGPWDPYVRDFDPTLNENSMRCVDAPVFSNLTEHERKGREENKEVDITNEEKVRQWREEKGAYLSTGKDNLILVADDGQEWVCLTKFCDTGRKNLDIDRLYIWNWLYAYFVTQGQATTLSEYANDGHPFISSSLASFHESYTIYNREYPWASSCHDFEETAYVDVWLKTGEVEMAVEQVLDGVTFGGTPEIQYREEIREREKEINIGKILHATTDLIWEEEYDASKEASILYSVPCAKLIETMGLKQLEADGFFCDSENKLAAFDARFTQEERTVVVRKDILDAFLEKTDLRLIWIVAAEKEIHAKDRATEAWSEWRGVYVYNGDCIEGEIHRTDITT